MEIKPQKIEYIDGDKKKGIKYNWKLIRKCFRALNIPKIFYNPLKADPEKTGYNWALSDRSRGKTTQCLLLVMVMHEMYDTIGQYVRNTRDMITPKNLRDLFETILEFGYIEKITGGRWNSCYYWANRWFYCQRDENGEIIEKAADHFLFCTCLDDSDKLKSSYNAPRGDIIIFDEFIMLGGYNYNDFIRFTDIESTIYRKRVCGITYMLSNTIDINSPWIDEFCIRPEIEMMQQGESRYIVTDEGTHIFCEILTPDETEQRKAFNLRFFGFNNPKLAAITGKGTWATEHYPHIKARKDEDNETEILYNRLFLYHNGKYCKLQIVSCDIGLAVYVFPATKTYNDSIILTSGEITDRRHIYGLGARGSGIETVWRLYRANRFYYATNADGALVRAYIKAVKDRERQRLM